MRLDLEEYDFVIEYIRERANYAADALSWIEFSGICKTNINDIFKVTTTLQSRNKQGRTSDTRKEDKNKLLEMLHVFEAINTEEYSKMPCLYFKNNNFIIQRGKNKLYESQNHIIKYE